MLNIGLIGLGYWGKNIYRNLLHSNKVNQIHILDTNELKPISNKNVYIYFESKKFFQNKQIDIFIITTPTGTHFKYLKKCLELKKNVCVTKPLTKNLEQLSKLKFLFDNTNQIFLDHTYLFHSSIRYIKKLVDNKRLGKLIYYDSERISFGKFYSDVDVIDDLAIHDLYILDFLLKGEMPSKISVNSHNIFGNKNFLSNISLTYPSGFFANIKVSWYSPIKSRRILLAGNKRIVEFDDNESDKKIKIYNKGIAFKKNKNINQWLYRTGSIEIPNIAHQESLEVMLNDLIKFNNQKNKNFDIVNHGYRVMKVLSQIKKKL